MMITWLGYVFSHANNSKEWTGSSWNFFVVYLWRDGKINYPFPYNSDKKEGEH